MRISDWSSDVCSSDFHASILGIQADDDMARKFETEVMQEVRRVDCLGADDDVLDACVQIALDRFFITDATADLHRHVDRRNRSEERRLGKECDSTCRSRRSPYRKKKKKQNTTQ